MGQTSDCQLLELPYVLNYVLCPSFFQPLILILLLFVIPVGLAAEEQSKDYAKAVLHADETFNRAVAERDRELFASLISEEATFMGGGLTQGREDIVKAWEVFLAEDRATVLWWQPHTVDVAASGDLAYTVGDYELRSTSAESGKTVATGTYVSVWKKHTDGSWKVVVDAGTPPQSAAAED